MLALKADNRGTAAAMQTLEHLLLLERWGETYKKISKATLNTIKNETSMEFIAATIAEHIFRERLL